MADNQPKRHHYVPQFYMQRFASGDDPNKVMTLERHGRMLAADRKSIVSIGYEEGLHDFEEDGVSRSVEGEINKVIETPFSASRTWGKIENGACADLTASDSLPIYGFARHLQRWNLATLRFMEAENARFRAGELTDLTAEERAMHERLANTPGGMRPVG